MAETTYAVALGASRAGDIGKLEELLRSQCVTPDFGAGVLLRQAIASRQVEAVKVLLRLGGTPTKAALSLALETRQPDLLEILLNSAPEALLKAHGIALLARAFALGGGANDKCFAVLLAGFGELTKAQLSPIADALLPISSGKATAWFGVALSKAQRR